MRIIIRCVILSAAIIGVVYVFNSSFAAVQPQGNGSAGKTAEAKALFLKRCATCHGKDGQAKTFKAKFDHARNLTDRAWQSEVSDERIFNSISIGRGRMPAFGKRFTEAEINGLVAYVRALKK